MIIQTERDTAPLLERIATIEQRIYARRHLLTVRSAGLMQGTRKKMRYSLTSPLMLILAAGAGFMLQRWVKHNFSRSPEEIELRRQKRIAKREKKLADIKKKRASGDRPGIMANGLKLIALVRTLIAALPSSWIHSLPGILRTKAAASSPAGQAQAQQAASTPTRYDGAGLKAR